MPSEEILDSAPPPADRRIAYGDDPNQFGDLRVPEGAGPFPAVIAIHGGFWREKYPLDYYGHVCQALTDAGWVTWNIEYRRVGQPGGGWPGTFHDVAAACQFLFDHATELNVDPARVTLIGHSAGGHLALWVAALAKVDPASEISAPAMPFSAVVSLAGAKDLQQMALDNAGDGAVQAFLGGGPDDFPERYRAASPYDLLPIGVPQLVIHGDLDDSVEVQGAVDYASRAAELGDEVILLRMKEADHFDIVDPGSATWARMWPTLERALRGEGWT